ncbi:acetylcholinesterase [Colletotrichum lupini]|uniref:Acetylcholinesterase n=1 Tax=Colletotrichum lupini TaxID=145971 RepID=A0A9Q8T707_9PEZI|nr:acetylcholinesterase [Colletotrichum lupini]UQC90479.1 acetylcholinesterase [Colletotrichum lupini]
MHFNDMSPSVAALAMLFSGLLPSVLASTCSNATQSAPHARTSQGLVKGYHDASCNSVFLGIPFAATTAGENRWRTPQDVPKSNTTVIATSYGPTCPQAISGTLYSQQDENCLNLNIWAPSTGENLPVFVYMYGGAMVTGSSSNHQLQGSNFARNGVIYVNFNTRESIFASPHSSELSETSPEESQNFSILDVEKALDWVRDNIHAFGGNPDHIVFGGHSSGAVQVDHYLWNHPDSWLKGAVQMSANAMSGPGYAPVNQGLDAVAAEAGCPKAGDNQVECLRSVDSYAFQTADFNSTFNTCAKQDTWVYRFFGAYDNVVGVPGTAPTHGTEVPFFHGGNECFDSLTGVTEAQQALADSIHGWFVDWIKNPAAGPGWAKGSPQSGPLVKLGVPGDELSAIQGLTGDFNARCKSVYAPAFPKYPVIQSPL